MENTYGIGIANRYELFYDQDDVTEFETVTTKKKEKKAKEPAQQQTTAPANGVPQKSAEKENKAVKKENGPGQLKAPVDQQQRRGIKEQQNNSNKDNSTRKEGGELSERSLPGISLFWKISFFGFSRVAEDCLRVCVRPPYLCHLGNCVNFPREKCVKVHLRRKKSGKCAVDGCQCVGR